MESNKDRILVIGGGSGGILTANILAEHGYKVTLISKSQQSIFQPGYVFVAFNGDSISRYVRPVKELLNKNVTFVNDAVSEVNLLERNVKTTSEKIFSYDKLVVAAGATLDYETIPGHRENYEKYGDYYSTPDAAERVWKNVKNMRNGKLVIAVPDLIIKCPPAPHKGVFLASNYFKSNGFNTTVELLYPSSHVYSEAELASIIENKAKEFGNISFKTSFVVDSIDNEKKVIKSMSGEEVKYDMLVVIPMHKGPEIKFTPTDIVDDFGFIKVDKYTLNISGFDDAFAVGDCNNTPTSKTGVAAHLGAFVVANRILGYNSQFTGRTNCPLVTNDEAIFVISDYQNPPVKMRFTKFKRLMEDAFVAMYWNSLKYPSSFEPIFDAYFKATEPEKIKTRGW